MKNPQELAKWLGSHFKLGDEQIEAIMNAGLPEGHSRLGQTALTAMLEELKLDVNP